MAAQVPVPAREIRMPEDEQKMGIRRAAAGGDRIPQAWQKTLTVTRP